MNVYPEPEPYFTEHLWQKKKRVMKVIFSFVWVWRGRYRWDKDVRGSAPPPVLICYTHLAETCCPPSTLEIYSIMTLYEHAQLMCGVRHAILVFSFYASLCTPIQIHYNLSPSNLPAYSNISLRVIYIPNCSYIFHTITLKRKKQKKFKIDPSGGICPSL